METNKDKLILIDKPVGITSFDIIRQLRKKLNIKKMGHAGTLDPRASGLMLIGIEDGTKKLKDLIGLPKVYKAEILLGVKTNTGDFDSNYPEGEGEGENGKIIEEKEIKNISEEKVKEVLKSLMGDTVLEVSLFSAMKRKGKSLYKYAQKGQEVTKPKRVMTVFRADFEGLGVGYLNKTVVKVEFEVGSGTYIRSLAEELGERLGTVATLQNLRRISIGDFKVEDAKVL
ncbi:tRNA pseudouridine(55) synthase TruB [Patescibacteria group bacterium]|nr:tRNA pseudouridine(55) synthase TruB [Patescibacteria group bacterium]